MFFPDYAKQMEKVDKASEKVRGETEKRLIAEYKTSLSSIYIILGTYYRKYSDGEGKLTYEELNRARRYESLLAEISSEVERLTKVKLDYTLEGLGKVFEEEYIGNALLIENAVGSNIGLAVLNPVFVEASVNQVIEGLTLSDRLAKDRNALEFAFKQEITQGLILAKSYKEMTKVIQEKLEGDVTKAARIVRTESNRVRNDARLSVYAEAENKGITMKKMWNARHDTRTRRNHRSLDGKMIGVDEEFKIGGFHAKAPHKFGKASMDVNCRCRIIGVPDGHVLPERSKSWEEVDNEWRAKTVEKLTNLQNRDFIGTKPITAKKDEPKPMTETEIESSSSKVIGKEKSENQALKDIKKQMLEEEKAKKKKEAELKRRFKQMDYRG